MWNMMLFFKDKREGMFLTLFFFFFFFLQRIFSGVLFLFLGVFSGYFFFFLVEMGFANAFYSSVYKEFVVLQCWWKPQSKMLILLFFCYCFFFLFFFFWHSVQSAGLFFFFFFSFWRLFNTRSRSWIEGFCCPQGYEICLVWQGASSPREPPLLFLSQLFSNG